MQSNNDIPPTFGTSNSESESGVIKEMPAQIELQSQPGDRLDAGPAEHEISDKFRYNMNHKNRGNFVIFNQENFDNNKPKKRNGTNTDRDNLKIEAQMLGFKVFVHNDLTLKSIKTKMEEYAQMDYKESDCFACAILTHGGEGDRLWARDEMYHLNDILSPIRDCRFLMDKPKLFFIQACRGQKLDSGVIDSVDAETIDDKSTPNLIIPKEADFLIGYSTVEGYLAWRNDKNGTWFIQALCKCLKEYGNSMEIMQIMTRVNQIVAHDHESDSGVEKYDGKKQMPSFVTRLTRDVYFSLPNNAMEIDLTDGKTLQQEETVKNKLEEQEQLRKRLELVKHLEVNLQEQDVLRRSYELQLEELELLK